VSGASAISRYPAPKLEDLSEDIRARTLEVQEKAGFIPNVFLAHVHQPGEFRAFLTCRDDRRLTAPVCGRGT